MSLSDISNFVVNNERRVQILDRNEPLLKENRKRFVLFPIQYDDIWQSYKENLKNFWVYENPGTSNVLSLLQTSDKTTVEKILMLWATYSEQQVLFDMSNDIQIPEARCFIGFQIYNQINHRELFSTLLRELVHPSQQHRAVPHRHIDIAKLIVDTEAFGGRLVGYSSMQLIYSSSLCVLKYVLQRSAGTIVPEKYVDMVLRDKANHSAFGALMFRHCVHQPTTEKIHKIVGSIVQEEITFLSDVLADRICVGSGIDADSLRALVQSQGDRVCDLFKIDKMFHCDNPFE